MKPLTLPDVRTNTVLNPRWLTTSVLYQLFSLDRSYIPAETLVRALAEAPHADVNETDGGGHSLLLNHLARYALPYPSWMASREKLMGTLGNWKQAADGTSTFEPHDGLRIAGLLLDRGADPWRKDQDGRDALDQMLHLMWLPLIERLLDQSGAPDATALESRRFTVQSTALPLLHAASATGNRVLLDLMLERGVNVNGVDDEGRTPVFLAPTLEIAQRLVNAGADLNHRLPDGSDVTAFWARHASDSSVLTALNLLAARHQRREGDDPGANLDRWRPALYTLATSGTKDNVLKFMRTHGFEADDQGPIDGRPRRLLTTVMRHLFNNPIRGTAVAQHLLERSVWLRSDDDASRGTLFTAWLGALGATSSSAGALPPKIKLLEQVEALIGQHYGWERPDGMVRFLDRFLPWAARQLPVVPAGEAVPDRTANLWCAMGRRLFLGLDRVLQGTCVVVSSRDPSALPAWLAKAAADPSIRVIENIYPKVVRQTFLDSGWTTAQRPDGMSYAWWWASLAAHLHLGRPSSGISVPSEVAVPLWPLLVHGDAGMTAPPADAMTVNTLMAVASLGNWDRQKPGWDPKNEQHGLFQAILAQGVAVDTSLPYHDERMAFLREKRPMIAAELETLILRSTMATLVDETVTVDEARPRRRL